MTRRWPDEFQGASQKNLSCLQIEF
jgi:hypothetical protein